MEKLNYKGFIHPNSEKEVIPCIQGMLKSAIENIKDKEFVPMEDVLELLKMLLEITIPTGYFYCPYVTAERPLNFTVEEIEEYNKDKSIL